MYSEDQAGKSGFESATSVKEATTGPQTTYPRSIDILTGDDSVNTMADTTAENNEYVEGLDKSLSEVKEYAANIHMTTTTDAAVEYLKVKLLEQRKQTANIL